MNTPKQPAGTLLSPPTCYRHCEFFEELEYGAEFRLLGERFIKETSNQATSERGEWWYLFPTREIVKASKGWSDESKFSIDNSQVSPHE
jgi:hypothetical protein